MEKQRAKWIWFQKSVLPVAFPSYRVSITLPLTGPSELAARSEARVESNQLLESIIVQLQNLKKSRKI